MKKIWIICIMILPLWAQQSPYNYTRAIGFDLADSLVAPYFCAVDTNGNIWVVSSSAISATAINALFKAQPQDSVFTLVYAFGLLDSVRDVTGLATIDDDVFIMTRKIPINPAAPDAYYYPYSRIFYVPNGDPGQITIFGRPNYGDYGTWYMGLAATRDGYLFSGQSYLVTIISADGRRSSGQMGFTLGYADAGNNLPLEPGGGLTYPNVIDLIRDVAVDPRADYSTTDAVVYTSRCSSPEGPGGSGGIAVWTGGRQNDPLNYRASRVTDVLSHLSWSSSSPYGITVHPLNGYLYACGTDSTRRWVKGFEVFGSFAVEMDELPAATPSDSTQGAPFQAPSDIAFTADGQRAYVADQTATKVFVFVQEGTGLADDGLQRIPGHFELYQNYPNPFNPITTIGYNVGAHHDGPVLVELTIYNQLGQKVAKLVSEKQPAGNYEVQWDASGLSSGVYLYRLSTDQGFTQTRKLVLMR